ncbi:hypothetical protein IAU60_002142 [Kwoniella sp. DSM 27419]
MPRRNAPMPYHSKALPPSPIKTRLQLTTYALSRLPPRQLPFLAAYAYCILYGADKGWIDQKALGKAGASIVGVLSMVTGLLLSYRFSSAIGKWDEGKQVWAGVRTTIRDGMRMLAIPTAPAMTVSSPASTSLDLGEPESNDMEVIDTSSQSGSPSSKTKVKGDAEKNSEKGKERHDPTAQKVNELAGLLVGFAYALQHHLHGTRPLPQPPLCDLLPPGYLSSLKRTEARVRFAESHAGPSGSASPMPAADKQKALNASSAATALAEALRPGLRRRGTGPPTREEKELAAIASGDDDWDLANLRHKAEEAVSKLAEAVASAGVGDDSADQELKQQLSQLNVPVDRGMTTVDPLQNSQHLANQTGPQRSRPKSNLYNPYPPNLPLALLKLMEAYIIGLAEVDVVKGGWAEAKRERGLAVVKALTSYLSDAERLSTNPPPLPLTVHLSHLLLIYLAALPCSLLCVVSGWALILITLIAGWCLLGLDALIGEVGGVFGHSENHHPLPLFSQQILNESLDVSPPFLRYYRTRLVARLGEDEEEVRDLDRRGRRGGEDWLPSFET